MVTDEQFDFYVNEVRQMKTELKEEINNVRTELNEKIDNVRAELKEEIGNVRTDLKEDVRSVRAELTLTRSELKAEIVKGRKETMDLREEYLEELARNSQQHMDIIKLIQSKVQDLDERKADKELKTA